MALRSSIWSLAWIGCWLLAFTLTHIPVEPSGVQRIPHFDKFAHFSVYFAIAYLGGLRLRTKTQATLSRLLLWAAIYIAYAAFDEGTQPLIGRDADMTDWLFDAIGVIVSTIALWMGSMPAFSRRRGIR